MPDKKACIVLFSGGTDSLCAAALLAEKYSEIHLLTFFEASTVNSPQPLEHVEKLRRHLPATTFVYNFFSTDSLVKRLSFHDYLKNLFRFGLYNLATPGLSSLSWHTRAIAYGRAHAIEDVYDGMTRELLHLPGHNPEIRKLFESLYNKFSMKFSSPVIDWEVPDDQRFIEKLIVDRHGFTIQKNTKKKTTGQWLYDKNILPHPNIKGSAYDRLSQHDCYPFVVYNILVFWVFSGLIGYDKFKVGLSVFMSEKIKLAESLLNSERSLQEALGLSFGQEKNNHAD